MSGPRILSVKSALTSHVCDQDAALAALRVLWGDRPDDRLEKLHRSVRVKKRHLAVPVEEYPLLDTFAKKNAAWTRVALELGERAVTDALVAAGLAPRDVDHVFFTTVTGIAVPSIDARLANKLGFRPDIKRTPLFGLGCVAGAAGTARASDYLRAFPDHVAVLLSIELCWLTLQREDLSVANLIASGLFGDGASAVVLAGERRAKAVRGPTVVASRSIFYPNTEDLMGWEVVEGGFRVVLSGRVPEIARAHLREDVDGFLGALELDRSEIKHWVAHTGGPKVLEAFQESLELPEGALARSWRSLENTGNLSSASVLLVLEDLVASGEAQPGDLGLMLAMGPGFVSELVLLRW